MLGNFNAALQRDVNGSCCRVTYRSFRGSCNDLAGDSRICRAWSGPFLAGLTEGVCVVGGGVGRLDACPDSDNNPPILNCLQIEWTLSIR